MFRVGHIINALDRPGGSERHLLTLLHGLSHKIESVVVCLNRPGELSKEVESMGIPLWSFELQRLSCWRVLHTSACLARRIRRNQMNVICAYGFAPSLIGGIAAWLTNLPFISARRELAQWRKPRHLAAFAFINVLADRITVNSASVETITEKEWFVREKIVRIVNGIDVPSQKHISVTSTLPPRLHDAQVVGVVANYRPVKNLGMLLDAAPLILSKCPNTMFWFIGEGPDRPNLEKKIEQMGLVTAVCLVGNRTDISSLLSQMNVFVLTSLAEGSPHAMLEAMAHGLPVVASSVGGVAELVKDGETGYLVKVNDHRGLAEKVVAILKDSERAERMGEKGRAQVLSDFSLNKMYDRYMQLYHDVVAN